RPLHRLARRRLPPQPHLRRYIPLSRRQPVAGGKAAAALRGGPAGVRRRAGGGRGDRRPPSHPRHQSHHDSPEEPARHRQQGGCRVRYRHPRRAARAGVSDKLVYGPGDWGGDYRKDLAAPGVFPFTRGLHPSMYRGRLWTMRQYAGFGTAEETNERFHHLLEVGQTGLSVAFDLPTQMGYDSDHPRAEGEVGRAGVAIDSVEDLERLFHGIPLDRVSTSMTINASAAILLAMYIAVGEEQGVPLGKLEGTLQNDILKEYIARGTYIYPPEPSLRLVADVFRFTSRAQMSFNPISI